MQKRSHLSIHPTIYLSNRCSGMENIHWVCLKWRQYTDIKDTMVKTDETKKLNINFRVDIQMSNAEEQWKSMSDLSNTFQTVSWSSNQSDIPEGMK